MIIRSKCILSALGCLVSIIPLLTQRGIQDRALGEMEPAVGSPPFAKPSVSLPYGSQGKEQSIDRTVRIIEPVRIKKASKNGSLGVEQSENRRYNTDPSPPVRRLFLDGYVPSATKTEKDEIPIEMNKACFEREEVNFGQLWSVVAVLILLPRFKVERYEDEVESGPQANAMQMQCTYSPQ